MNLDHPLFSEQDIYSLVDLNDVVQRFANNDENLRDIVVALQRYMSVTPFPPGSGVLSPAQLIAVIDTIYGNGSTTVRLYPVVPPEVMRSLQEDMNTLAVEPFLSLLEGAKLNPSAWLPILRVFTMLKGITYLVEDGPDYEVAPTYIKDGSFFFTTVTDPANTARHMLVDGIGAPALANGGFVYQPLPLGVVPITLMEFMLRGMEVQKLRTLYRIGCFEAGVDTKYDNSYPYDLVTNTFTAPSAPPARRFPCGFIQAGKFLYLRSEAGKYRGSDLSFFKPGLTPLSGVEDRVVMDESLVQTPMGVFRMPKCILNIGALITDGDRVSDPNKGDPVFFFGLHFQVQVVKRDPLYASGVALPAIIQDISYDNIIPMVKDAVAEIENYPTPITGTQAQHYSKVSSYGFEHGTVIGFIQKDGSNTFGQYLQVHVSLTVTVLYGSDVFDQLLTVPVGQVDEIGKLAELGTDVDVTPWRTFGIGPRRILPLVAGTMGVDLEQGCLVRTSFTASASNWECTLPVGLYLTKNQNFFGVSNLNGCQTRFTDAWAIRKVSSTQPNLNTVIFDDGAGSPEDFPENFIGSEVTFFHADGITDTTTVVERVGDSLARLPADVFSRIQPDDIATFNRRVPSTSSDGTYQREISETNVVDLRLLVRRLVDPVVIPSDYGLVSPSPSPAVPWTALRRDKPIELAQAAIDLYSDPAASIASKVRWHYAQKFLSLASQRQDLITLTGTAEDLHTFLLRYVSTYEQHGAQEWVLGEDTIIHWPAKNPVTKVSLRNFFPPVMPGVDDGITIEEVKGWGPVPVLTKHLRSVDNYPYPLRFVTPLVFASEKSFVIPGHTKLAGSFRLQPEDTWIVDHTVTFRLYQTRNQNGTKERVLLGTVELDWTRATSFKNATGVFRIDGDASYEPTSGYSTIAYNQILDFTGDEPGTLDVTFIYHDLSQTHPVYQFNYAGIGLKLSHLANTEVFAVVDGQVQPAIAPVPVRLEGLTANNGSMFIRFNRDDSYKVIGQRGFFRTKWVLRGIRWITITNVIYDGNGQPVSVEYVAQNVNENMTVSTLLANDSRARQVYLPCDLLYGWTDLAQGNINTEAIPFNADDPVFGFFELQNVKGVDGALTVPTATIAFKTVDIDYRFLEPFTSITDLEGLRSVAILRNTKTGATRAVAGVYRAANNTGSATAFLDELTLDTVHDQNLLFVLDTASTDEVLDFAGILCAARDELTATQPMGSSKMVLVGYWYNGHSLEERAGTAIRFTTNAVQFSSPSKAAGNWRIGDVPMSFLYRGNTLLETDRRRPPL